MELDTTEPEPSLKMDLLADGTVHVTNSKTIVLSLGTNMFYSADALAALVAERDRLREELAAAKRDAQQALRVREYLSDALEQWRRNNDE